MKEEIIQKINEVNEECAGNISEIKRLVSRQCIQKDIEETNEKIN